MGKKWHYKLYSLLLVILLCLIFLEVTPAKASEVWMWMEKEGSTDFVQKINEQFIILHYPEKAGTLHGYTSSTYKARDGFLAIGFAQHKIMETNYNLPMAEFFYYLINKADLPKLYTDLDLSLLSYQRNDVLVDIFLTQGAWELTLGGKLLLGRDYYHFLIQDGTASNSLANLYDFCSNYSLYKGYPNDYGHGLGYYFTLNYQPTTNWRFSLSGDDLAAYLIWSGLDGYEGIIDLNFLKEDDNGFSYYTAPMKGHFYEDSVIRMNLTPTWRGEIHYEKNQWQWETWVRYQKNLAFGTKGVVTYKSWPGLSLGIQHRNNQWLGTIGVEWPELEIEFAANATNRTNLTGYFFQIKTHLF